MLKKNIIRVIFFSVALFLSLNYASAESVKYVHSDHLGSTSVVTNENGELISNNTYYPYGNTNQTQGTSPTERKYTGQISDQGQTNLYYYNARYYNPKISKFTQADTFNDQQNRYAYVNNNPVKFADPTGQRLDIDDPYYNWQDSNKSPEDSNYKVYIPIFLSNRALNDGKNYPVSDIEEDFYNTHNTESDFLWYEDFLAMNADLILVPDDEFFEEFPEGPQTSETCPDCPKKKDPERCAKVGLHGAVICTDYPCSGGNCTAYCCPEGQIWTHRHKECCDPNKIYTVWNPGDDMDLGRGYWDVACCPPGETCINEDALWYDELLKANAR